MPAIKKYLSDIFHFQNTVWGVYFFVKVTPVVSDNERKPYGLYKTYVIDFLMLQPWQPFRRKPFSYWDPDGTADTAEPQVLPVLRQ